MSERKSFIDWSRIAWVRPAQAPNGYSGDDAVQLGCLQRIASSLESIAESLRFLDPVHVEQAKAEQEAAKRRSEHETVYAAWRSFWLGAYRRIIDAAEGLLKPKNKPEREAVTDAMYFVLDRTGIWDQIRELVPIRNDRPNQDDASLLATLESAIDVPGLLDQAAATYTRAPKKRAILCELLARLKQADSPGPASELVAVPGS